MLFFRLHRLCDIEKVIMFDVDMFRRTYPEFFSSPVTGEDIVKWFLVFILSIFICISLHKIFRSQEQFISQELVDPVHQVQIASG